MVRLLCLPCTFIRHSCTPIGTICTKGRTGIGLESAGHMPSRWSSGRPSACVAFRSFDSVTSPRPKCPRGAPRATPKPDACILPTTLAPSKSPMYPSRQPHPLPAPYVRDPPGPKRRLTIRRPEAHASQRHSPDDEHLHPPRPLRHRRGRSEPARGVRGRSSVGGRLGTGGAGVSGDCAGAGDGADVAAEDDLPEPALRDRLAPHPTSPRPPGASGHPTGNQTLPATTLYPGRVAATHPGLRKCHSYLSPEPEIHQKLNRRDLRRMVFAIGWGVLHHARSFDVRAASSAWATSFAILSASGANGQTVATLGGSFA